MDAHTDAHLHHGYHHHRLAGGAHGVIASDLDDAGPDGKVHDDIRETFLKDFITARKYAVDEGYYTRPALVIDNFAWRSTYGSRFDHIRVACQTQKCIIKEPAWYYASIIASNGEEL